MVKAPVHDRGCLRRSSRRRICGTRIGTRETAIQIDSLRVGARRWTSFVAIEIHQGNDPDFDGVDKVGDTGIGAVVRRQVVDKIEAHLRAHPLGTMNRRNVAKLRFILFEIGIVGDE